MVVAALTAREPAGGHRAQLVTAGVYATAPFLLGQGHLLSTNTVPKMEEVWFGGTAAG